MSEHEPFIAQPHPEFEPSEVTADLPVPTTCVEPILERDPRHSHVLNEYSSDIEPTNGAITTTGLSDFLEARSAGKGYLLIEQTGGREPTIKHGTKTEFDGFRWWGGDWQSHTANVAKLSLAATVLVNGIINFDSIRTDVAEEASKAADSVEAVADSTWDARPWKSEPIVADAAAEFVDRIGIECSVETEPSIEETIFIPSNTEAGSQEFTTDQANRLSDEIIRLEQDERVTVTGISINGLASDEWGSTPLGEATSGNEILAQERAESFAELVSQSANIDLDAITLNPLSSSETILDTNEIQELVALAEQFGYSSPDAARRLYDNPDTRDQLPPQMRAALDIYFGEQRGVNVMISYTVDGEEIVACVPVVMPEVSDEKEPETPREDTNNDYRFIPIILPVPPLPTWRKRPDIKVIPGKAPRTRVTKIQDDTFVKLYPRAIYETDVMTANGETQTVFSDDAWAWSRKYQALLRDDRIEAALTHRFIDENNVERALRVMFVDHEPTQATVTAFAELLEQFAQLRDGTMSENLHAIAVFPSENAGQQSSPRQIGLGLDEQYESAVLGVAIPTVGLVEMHMPKKPTAEDLDGIMGARWTLAHEAGGHFTDVNQPRIEAVALGAARRIFNIPRTLKADYATRMPWNETAAKLFKKLKHEQYIPGREYEITTAHQDLDGDIEHATSQVYFGRDIDRAQTIRKIGFPTQYSETQEAELYAESAAQVLTGIELPVPGIRPNQDGFNFAQGANVDARLANMVGKRVGGQFLFDNPDSPIFALDNQSITETGQTTYGPIETDPELLRLARAARITPLPPEEELLTVKAKVVGLNS